MKQWSNFIPGLHFIDTDGDEVKAWSKESSGYDKLMLLYGYLNGLNHRAKQTVCGAGMQTVCEFVGLLTFYFRESVLEQHGKPQVGKHFFVTHNDIAHGAVCVCALGNTENKPAQVSVSISGLLLPSTNHLLS